MKLRDIKQLDYYSFRDLDRADKIDVIESIEKATKRRISNLEKHGYADASLAATSLMSKDIYGDLINFNGNESNNKMAAMFKAGQNFIKSKTSTVRGYESWQNRQVKASGISSWIDLPTAEKSRMFSVFESIRARRPDLFSRGLDSDQVLAVVEDVYTNNYNYYLKTGNNEFMDYNLIVENCIQILDNMRGV